MSRVGRYQENISKFLQTKSFINKTSTITKKILTELMIGYDHVPAMLCLTVLNSQCKKYNIKLHGYYVAGCVDVLMILAKVCCNRPYFNKLYGTANLNNLIIEVINWTYCSIYQNIETLLMNKGERYNPKTTQLCIDYCVKLIPKIVQVCDYTSNKRMKKTDIYSYKPSDADFWKKYKNKALLDKTTVTNEIDNRYGSVCCLSVCLGWILGQGDESALGEIEKLGKYCGILLKMSDDFRYLEQDITEGHVSTNYVINFGIKETYTAIIEAKANLIEELLKNKIDGKTLRDAIDVIIRMVDDIVSDISVDMNTQYDECSTFSEN